jgi:hypothetical protein
MIGSGSKCVVGYASRCCPMHPCRVGEERIEPSVASVVEIKVDAAVVCEDEVSDDIRPLAVGWVCIVCIKEPRELIGNEFTCCNVCPKLERVNEWFTS